jgi:hypothetical protein
VSDSAEEAAPIIELACDEPGCSFVARGPETGKGSVRFILGGHRYNAHKMKGTGRKRDAERSARARTGTEEGAARPVVSALRDIADDVDGKGKPSADALGRAFGRGLGYVSMAVAAYAVETDETIPFGPEGEAIRDAQVDDLSLTPKAATEMMAPTRLNQRYGRAMVDNVDSIAAVAELATWALHWRRYFRARRYRAAALGAQGAPPGVWPGAPIDVVAVPVPSPGPASPTPETVTGNGHVETTSAAPQNGVVVDASMVETMRRNRG